MLTVSQTKRPERTTELRTFPPKDFLHESFFVGFTPISLLYSLYRFPSAMFDCAQSVEVALQTGPDIGSFHNLPATARGSATGREEFLQQRGGLIAQNSRRDVDPVIELEMVQH